MCVVGVFVYQAEDGIRDLVRSRGLGDVYKRQSPGRSLRGERGLKQIRYLPHQQTRGRSLRGERGFCLLYTSDAADERSSVDLGGRRIIKKKNTAHIPRSQPRR